MRRLGSVWMVLGAFACTMEGVTAEDAGAATRRDASVRTRTDAAPLDAGVPDTARPIRPDGEWRTDRFDGLEEGEWMLLQSPPHLRYAAFFREPERTAAQTEADRYEAVWPAFRVYSSPILGRGVIYYMGGGHGGYAGNEVDVYDIATNTWRQEYKPNVAPPGDSIYGGGGSGSSWVDPMTGLNRPYTIHGWGRQSYDPVTDSYVVIATLCESIVMDGTGAYTCERQRLQVIAYRDGAWRAIAPTRARSGIDLSDYDEDLGGILSFGGEGDEQRLLLYRSDGTVEDLGTTSRGLARSGGAPHLYVPSMHGHLVGSFGHSATAVGALLFFDSRTHAITDLTPTVPEALRRHFDALGNFAMTYDSIHDVVICASIERDDGGSAVHDDEYGRPHVWIFHPADGSFTDIGISASAPRVHGIGPGYGREPLMFEAVNNVVLFLQHDGVAPKLFAYRHRAL